MKTAAFVGRNRRGRLGAAPARGLASEARNVQLPGVSCGFPPRTMAAAEGVGPRGGRQLKTTAFVGAKPLGAVGALTPLPLPSPLSQPWERGEGEHASSHSGAGAEG